MSTPLRLLCILICAPFILLPQSTGSGVTGAITARFINAFERGNFRNLVIQPPVADVHSFGTTGLIQEFYTSGKTSKAALILPDQTKIGFDGDVLQVFPGIYAYYSTLSVTTVGYPTEDTQECPGVASCTFQFFTNNYALFSIPTGNANGTQFAVSGDIFVKWNGLGNIFSPLGIVSSASQTVTSSAKTTATIQAFTGGEIDDITSGTYKAQAFAVIGAVDTLYQSAGGPTGPLGLPISDQVLLAGGIQRQQFESGKIQFPTGGTPAILFPVSQITVSPGGPFALKSGQTVTLTETAFDTQSQPAIGRTVSWSTTNGQVVNVVATGNTAVVKGLGSGTATVTASSEGIVSSSVVFTVTAPCCAVGEGAPSVAISQTFQDAVTRNQLSVLIPGPNPVQRLSAGYTQDLVSTDGTTHYLIAKGDQSGIAYVVSGAQLAAYTKAGGPSGSLGFPLSDVSAGGTQLFANGALSGSPLQLVSGAVLTKWALLKYDTGPAGVPTAAATPFTTQSGYGGQAQQFTGGVIYGISTGNRAGQGYLVTGAILTRYLALGGPAGSLGLPVSDVVTTGTVQRENFENGYIDFTMGAAAAQEHLVPRTPAITTNPTSALAGSRLHLSVTGFANGATIRVSVTGQPDFTVTTPGGSYDWDILIDSSAKSSTVAISAVDVSTGAKATGSYTVRTVADANPALTKSLGDNQTGTPGSLLPVLLSVTLKDSSGAPLSGVAVSFSPSPGSQVSPAQAVTDANGTASTAYRLPTTAGLGAVTASSLGKLAIFDARAVGNSASIAFPTFTQASGIGVLGRGTDAIADKGSLLTTVAAVIRFYQNQGLLPTPNGFADPNTLNQFLTQYCAPGTQVCDGFVSQSGSSEQVVNVFRVAAFAGGNLIPSVEDPSLSALRDLAAAGSPVILSLALTEDGAPSGGTTIVATGIGADGSVQIYDPNPSLGRTSFNDYFGGFSALGHTWKGTLLSTIRLIPGQPSAIGFVLESVAQPLASLPAISAQSPAGSCARPFLIQNADVVSAAPGSIAESSFVYCDGTQSLYLVSFTASSGVSAAVTDLAPGGGTQSLASPGSAGYQITRAPAFAVSAPAVSFTNGGVVNAASFAPAISPGEIVSIFGSGLSGPGQTTQVSVAGSGVTILLATPFQLNAQIPAGLAPGTYPITVTSAYGSYTQPITVASAAPGIFILSTNADNTSQGAVVNQSGAVNSSTAPAKRGETIVIYGTGLGAVLASGGLSRTTAPVTAILAGTELPVAFSGLAPGFIGLYQVNLAIPPGTPPGLSLSLVLREAGLSGNTVQLALQ